MSLTNGGEGDGTRPFRVDGLPSLPSAGDSGGDGDGARPLRGSGLLSLLREGAGEGTRPLRNRDLPSLLPAGDGDGTRPLRDTGLSSLARDVFGVGFSSYENGMHTCEHQKVISNFLNSL